MAMLGFSLTGLAHAQWGGWPRDDRDRDYHGSSQQAYRDGYSQGQADRAANRRYNFQTGEWRNGDGGYRDAYRSGYDRGFNSGYNGGYGAPNGRNYPYGNNYPYGKNYPDGHGGRSGYGNQAYSTGLQDGRRDGENDFRTGHSYRPTQDSNYKHADRGYNSSFGSKDAYKQEYRNGYMAGYSQGYRR
jgi:hypothetical protein